MFSLAAELLILKSLVLTLCLSVIFKGFWAAEEDKFCWFDGSVLTLWDLKPLNRKKLLDLVFWDFFLILKVE